MSGQWNRSGRKSGGFRSTKIIMGPRDGDYATIHEQREEVRRQFGEEGVKKFDELLLRKAKEQS